MFSKQELSIFQSSYFSNFSYKNSTIEVQSANTGHWWQIFKKDMPRSTMIVTLHKYNKDDKYHMQCHVHTLLRAYRMIKSHDEYILDSIASLTTQP